MIVSEFKERDKVVCPLMITNILNGVTNSGQPYASLSLQDKSGTIEGKVWNISKAVSDRLAIGLIVEVEGDVISYRGQLQLKIQTLNFVDQDQYNLEEFVVASKISKEELEKSIQSFIDEIDNPVLNHLVTTYFNRHKKNLFLYPAATKNHHNYVGGLMTHVLEMLTMAKDLVKVYPFLNKSLLYAGCLVHDAGKIEEYDQPVTAAYSVPGRLLGHISIAQAQFYELACELGIDQKEEVLLLRHMILAHHGEYEFGSPVRPMIAEAEALHLIDNLSARMTMFESNLAMIDPGSFSGRIFSLENRSIYKPVMDSEMKKP